jgi:hypothetical protein
MRTWSLSSGTDVYTVPHRVLLRSSLSEGLDFHYNLFSISRQKRQTYARRDAHDTENSGGEEYLHCRHCPSRPSPPAAIIMASASAGEVAGKAHRERPEVLPS